MLIFKVGLLFTTPMLFYEFFYIDPWVQTRVAEPWVRSGIPSFCLRDNSVQVHQCTLFWIGISPIYIYSKIVWNCVFL